MKTYKQFVSKKKNDDDDFVVLSDVIHFKAGVDHKHNADKKFKPSVKKEKGHYVKEEETKPGSFQDWQETNDNPHLGETHEEIGNTLKHSDSPLYDYGGEFNPNETKEERDKRWVYQSRRDAIRQYTAGSEKLNKALIRKNKKFFEDGFEKDRLDRLDAITDEHRAKHDHVLYSGLTFDPRKKLKGKNKFISPAFISATHAKNITTDFAKPIANDDAPEGLGSLKQHKTMHIMQINVPTGARVTNISTFSTYKGEHESLIGRNSKFEYSHAEPKIDESGNRYLIHHVHLIND
jgi:hypothetical protein